MRNCDQNIAKLREENKQREGEIDRKKKQLLILQAKRERIGQQLSAVAQYETFLEKVKNNNSDEFMEVTDIRSRHSTLSREHGNLIAGSEYITNKLDEKRAEVQTYEKLMDQRIMQINNEISILTKKSDEVEAEKSSLQNDEEETSARKWEKISELSQVIFAIDMIEGLCSKKTAYH